VTVTLAIDDAVGELRRVLLDAEGRPFRMDMERWSERASRARVGEIWRGCVRGAAPGALGWFVDLGPGGTGLLEAARGLSLAEGEWVSVRVRAEAGLAKGPQLTTIDPPDEAMRPDGAGRWAPAKEDAFLHGVKVTARLEGAEARDAADAALEEAMGWVSDLPGGGNISIEATRGVTAIDVDAAGRTAGAAGFAFALNREAAEDAARSLSLRGVGGPVVIDFLRMRDAGQRREIADALRQALRRRTGRRPEVLEISPLGLCEVLLPRTRRRVADAFATTPPDEREALETLRAIERAGWMHRGSRIRARVSQAAADWLARDAIGWQSALAGRIGWRWIIETQTRPSSGPDVGIES
jgi:Ribonuclease G/E